MSKLLQECPDIGEVIETYVQDRNVGADAWRRTGVLTLDGNVQLKETVTYERIRQHLVDVYKLERLFSSVWQETNAIGLQNGIKELLV